MSEWYDQISSSLDDLNGVALQLDGLGRAFAQTGNAYMAKTLWDLSETIAVSASNIQGARSAYINQEYRRAQEATGNMLTGMLLAAERMAQGQKPIKAMSDSLDETLGDMVEDE